MYDINETVALVERAVNEKGPDYVFPARGKEYRLPNYWNNNSQGMCRYFTLTDHKPACIVGQVLAYVGLEDRALEGQGAASLDLEDSFTSEAQYFLSEVQGYQDGGESWGAALLRAKADVRFRSN